MAANTRTYSDIDLRFIPHPITGDIVRVLGDAAVIQSVETLVMTNYYERKFHSEIGSIANQLLFELPTPLTLVHLKDGIKNTLKNFEKRVDVKAVNARYIEDADTIQVDLIFFILNNSAPTSTTIFLQRTR